MPARGSWFREHVIELAMLLFAVLAPTLGGVGAFAALYQKVGGLSDQVNRLQEDQSIVRIQGNDIASSKQAIADIHDQLALISRKLDILAGQKYGALP